MYLLGIPFWDCHRLSVVCANDGEKGFMRAGSAMGIVVRGIPVHIDLEEV